MKMLTVCVCYYNKMVNKNVTFQTVEKQLGNDKWGNWVPLAQFPHNDFDRYPTQSLDTQTIMAHVGKKRAGRLLDGREWNQFPVPLASKAA